MYIIIAIIFFIERKIIPVIWAADSFDAGKRNQIPTPASDASWTPFLVRCESFIVHAIDRWYTRARVSLADWLVDRLRLGTGVVSACHVGLPNVHLDCAPVHWMPRGKLIIIIIIVVVVFGSGADSSVRFTVVASAGARLPMLLVILLAFDCWLLTPACCMLLLQPNETGETFRRRFGPESVAIR
uniref:G-protein coupled receptors family 1 profile domain-containing protein n=1 Tax=Anopheles farauti TaxID=69004 RepID=A0A182QR61_9DIPT